MHIAIFVLEAEWSVSQDGIQQPSPGMQLIICIWTPAYIEVYNFFFFSERKKGPLLMRLERKSPADKWWWTESPSLHIRKICLDVCDRWPCWSRGGGPDDLQGSLPPSTLLWFYDTATEQRDRPKIQHLTSSTIHLHSFSLQKFPHSTFINNFTGNYLYFYIPGTIIFAAQSPT